MATLRTALRTLRTTLKQTTRPENTRNLSTGPIANFNRTIARSQLSTPFNAIRNAFRTQVRKQTADATAAAENESALMRLWKSPVGPRTVHFWAPITKWGVVLAGVTDMFRPPETLSLQQNLALMATGAIWTRWCFVIRPKNPFLATVNFFLFCNGATQVTRVLRWRSQQDSASLGTEIQSAAKEEGNIIKGVVQKPGQTLEKAEERAKAGN
ncbi:MAG: hypothetical protein Q9159_002685 [Coniocarpon cinnabarinum]